MSELPAVPLLVLSILAISSTHGNDEKPSSTNPIDPLLQQKFIITDPYMEFFSDPGKNLQAMSMQDLFETRPLSINHPSSIDLGASLTNLLGESIQASTIPIIALPKVQFSYFLRLKHFHEFGHTKDLSRWLPKKLFIMIIGPPRSGKTLSLRYLYESVRSDEPNLLPIFIDLPGVLNNLDPFLFENLSIDDILNACISDELVDLVKNLQKVKSSKLRFLFDGVDQVPIFLKDKILNIITKLLNRGIKVAISSNFDILEAFLDKAPNVRGCFSKIQIQDNIEGENLREYMTKYWINKFYLKNVQLDEKHVNDYYTALEIIMESSPLPRSIATMEQLADYFSDTSIEKLIPDVSIYALKSNTQRPKLSELFQLAEKTHISKLAFYDKYFEKVQPHEVKYYGTEALCTLAKSIKFKSEEWQQSVRQSKELEKTYSREAFPYLAINVQRSVFRRFVQQEYLYYFAAKQILTSFTTDTPYIKTVFKVLKTESLHFIAEYIDEFIKLMPPEKALGDFYSPLRISRELSHMPIAFNILNNLFGYGFDTLCSEVLKIIGLKAVADYFSIKDLSSQTFRIFTQEYARSFGMLSLYRPLKNHILSIPRKQHFPLNKFDLMLKYDMVKTHDAAEKLGFKKWPMDYLTLYSAKKSAQSLELYLNTIPNVQKIYQRIFQQVAFESVEKLGPKSVDILITLKKFGARFSGVTDSNGRTLAHVAVQWADPDLLETVHKKLSVPLIDQPDVNGKTILFTALDSSPFLIGTPDGFWPMMEYLIKHGDLTANYEELQKTISSRRYQITTLMHPYYAAMFTAGQLSNIDKDIFPYAKTVFQFIPLKDWGLPIDLLSGRRNAVIKDSLMYILQPSDYVTLSELIIKHRSLDTLSEKSQDAYENVVLEILRREMLQINLKPNQMQRVFINIIKNMHTRSEFLRIKATYLIAIRPNVIPQSYAVIDELFDLREHNQIIKEPPRIAAEKILGITTKMDIDSTLIDDLSLSNVDLNVETITAELRAACIEFLSI